MENKRYKPTFGDGLTVDQRYYRRHRLNRLKNSIYTKKYYQKNKEYWKIFAKNRNKEEFRKICKDWRLKNKDRIKILGQRRKARLRNGGELTIQTIQQVYEDNIKRYSTLTCYLCLKPIEFGKDTLEHKIPLSRGGTNIKENLDIACYKCNVTKKDKTVEEFLVIK